MQSHIKSLISSSELFQKLFLFKTLKFILSLGSWDNIKKYTILVHKTLIYFIILYQKHTNEKMNTK